MKPGLNIQLGSAYSFGLNIQAGYACGVTDDTPWLDTEQLVAWMHLVGLTMALPAEIDAQLKRDSCLNFFEYSILSGLSNRPGRSMQMSHLALWSWGSQSRLSHAVTRLEKHGFVERRSGSAEPRAVEAVLTEAGVAKLVEAAPQHVRAVRRLVIDVLTPEELTQLKNIARRILAAASPDGLRPIDEAAGAVHQEEVHTEGECLRRLDEEISAVEQTGAGERVSAVEQRSAP